MPRKTLPLVLCIAAGVLSPAGRSHGQGIERKADEKRIHQVDKSWLAGTLQPSPDNRRFAYVVQKGRVDPKTRRPGPAAKEKKMKLFVVLDGKPQEKTYEDIGPDFLFSPDSKHFAYAARQGKEVFLVVNGVELTKYDDVLRHSVAFSPDSRRLAYLAVKEKKCYAVVQPAGGQAGAEEQGPYDDLAAETTVFSPDSKHLAWAARVGEKWFLVLDKKKQKACDGIIDGSVKFSADGRRLAYAAVFDGRWCVVLDGKGMTRHDNVGQITLSPDGRRLAYAGREEDKQYVVLDEKRGSPYDGIVPESLAFSADGKRFGYMVETTKRKQFLVVDGKEVGKQYANVLQGPLFSPDGTKLIYIARGEEKKQFVVVAGPGGQAGGREHERYDRVGGGSIAFSPDGKRMAYAAMNNRQWFVCVDERVGRAYGLVKGITFTPDSRHVVYAAQKGRHQIVVVGRNEGLTYQRILSLYRGPGVVFDSGTEFRYLAGIKHGIFAVREKIVIKKAAAAN